MDLHKGRTVIAREMFIIQKKPVIIKMCVHIYCRFYESK